MISKFHQHLTSIIGTLVTIALTLFSDFILNLPPEITWLTFFIGVIITITMTLLELKIIDIITTKLGNIFQIYSYTEKIEDPEFRQLADTAIAECLQKLHNYSINIISQPIYVSWYATERLERCKNRFQAVFWALDLENVYAFEDDVGDCNYFNINVNAAKRGVKLERIFVYKKFKALDENGIFFDQKCLNIMKTQQDAGIDVRVSWLEGWHNLSGSNEMFQDFAIFDEIEVGIVKLGAAGSECGITIIKNPQKVKEYQTIFQRLHNFSRPLSEIIKEYTKKE